MSANLDVRIRVGGEEFSEWQSYSIESSLTTPADAFTITIPNHTGKQSEKFAVHQAIEVYVAGTLQMSGYIDTISYSIAGGTAPTIEISGRDRFGQLVDTSATPKTYHKIHLIELALRICSDFVPVWKTENEVNRIATVQAAEKLAQVRQGDVQGAVDGDRLNNFRADALAVQASKAMTNKALAVSNLFSKVKVEPGESPMDVLSEYAKKIGLHVWCGANGEGIIAKPNYGQKPLYNLYLLPPSSHDRRLNNILSASIERDATELFSNYRYVLDVANDKSNKNLKFIINLIDNNVSLSRSLYVSSGEARTRKEATAIAERDRDKRSFDALTLDYTVRGHANSNALWQTDTLCAVTDEVNKVSGTYYVVSRKFEGDQSSGQRTQLSLKKKDLWLA